MREGGASPSEMKKQTHSPELTAQGHGAGVKEPGLAQTRWLFLAFYDASKAALPGMGPGSVPTLAQERF